MTPSRTSPSRVRNDRSEVWMTRSIIGPGMIKGPWVAAKGRS